MPPRLLLVFLICLSSSVLNWLSVSGAPLTLPKTTSPKSSQAGPHAQCLTHISPEERAEFERGLVQARSWYPISGQDLEERDTKSKSKPKHTKDNDDRTANERYIFNVSFNVVFTNETREGGWVPDNDIQAQMAVLNADYNSTGISFVLVKTTRIKSPDWFANVYPGSPQEQAMKRIYNIGDASTLNVYTLTFNSTIKSLGASSIPSAYYRDPLSDGVMVRHSTITHGPRLNYNMGRTLVHEVGHWLGLFHTFEGGCDDGVGDNIADTPPQASGSEGCPVGRDSCPGGGVDLINNFMDYSFDACMSSFTKGQATRMREAAKAFRRPGGATATSTATMTRKTVPLTTTTTKSLTLTLTSTSTSMQTQSASSVNGSQVQVTAGLTTGITGITGTGGTGTGTGTGTSITTTATSSSTS